MLEELLLGECSFEQTNNLTFKSIYLFDSLFIFDRFAGIENHSYYCPIIQWNQSYNPWKYAGFSPFYLDVPFVDGNLQIDDNFGVCCNSFQYITSLERIEADEGGLSWYFLFVESSSLKNVIFENRYKREGREDMHMGGFGRPGGFVRPF